MSMLHERNKGVDCWLLSAEWALSCQNCWGCPVQLNNLYFVCSYSGWLFQSRHVIRVGMLLVCANWWEAKEIRCIILMMITCKRKVKTLHIICRTHASGATDPFPFPKTGQGMAMKWDDTLTLDPLSPSSQDMRLSLLQEWLRPQSGCQLFWIKLRRWS